MGYANHVGRVGALAAALGIGAAVAFTPGVAWADGETDSPPSADGGTPGTPADSDASAPSSERPDPGAAIRHNIERAADDVRDGLRRAITGVVRNSGGALTGTHRTGSGATNGNVPPVVVDEDEDQAQTPDAPKGQPSAAGVNENPVRGFTPPRWRAPQAQVTTQPAHGPVAKVLDGVKQSAQQTLGAVSGSQQAPTGSNVVQRSAVSTLETPSTEAVGDVRTPFVAPIRLVTNVLNAALAPFLNPTPGQPAPQNPILWAVLGWVRRQFQDTPFGKIVLNRTPQMQSVSVDDDGGGTFTITPSATDPDGDDLTYSVAVTGEGDQGTLTENDNGTFTYVLDNPDAWDGSDTLTVTVSDEQDYPHLHGLFGFFSPGGGHTDSQEFKVESTAAPTPEVIELPDGYTVVGNGSASVSADGKIYRATKHSDNGVDAYALVVQRPGGDTEIIDLPGEPIGELAFGPSGKLYQNIQTPNTVTGGYDYAMTVITPSPAAATFALMASNALDSGTVSAPMPGQPVGPPAIGSDGTAYQLVRPSGESATPDTLCEDCSVAIVLPGSSTAQTVDLTGQLLALPPRGTNALIPEEPRYVTAGPNGTAYLTSVTSDSTATTVWRVHAGTEADPATVEDIVLPGHSFSAPWGATIAADGTAYKATEALTRDDTKLWVIEPDSGTAKPFQLEGDIDSPVAVDDNGIAYLTTSRPDFDGTESVMIWRVDPTTATPTLIEVDGDVAGSVLVTPGGTAYQLVTRKVDPNSDDLQYVMAVIRPGSTEATIVDLGTFSGLFPQNSTTMTPEGKVYQVLGNFDLDTFSGDTTVFIFDGTTHRAIPLEGVASTPVAVGAGGKAYVVTATNIDRQTLTGDETLWVIDPSGTQPLEVPIDTVGTPVSLSVGGDSAFFTTLRIDVSDPNMPQSIYEVIGVTIPSEAV